MSTPCKKLPIWLSNAYSDSHIDLVLRILAHRESQREKIRSISRYRTTQQVSCPTNSPHRSIPQEDLEHYSVALACHEHNIRSNRYLNILPYDRTRVTVGYREDRSDDKGGFGRYLNANWVLERYGHKWWIATQAPLPTTVHTFLSLILQPTLEQPLSSASQATPPQHPGRIRTVVQLTRNTEGGRPKAHAYLPTEVGKSFIISPDPEFPGPNLRVTLLALQNHEAARCVHSTIAIGPTNLTCQGQSLVSPNAFEHQNKREDDYGPDGQRLIFQHLLYTAWPDHGVPEEDDRASLLAFLKLVDQTNRDFSQSTSPQAMSHDNQRQHDPDPPIIVGCSAGIGRTGSFIALSSLLRHTGILPLAANPGSASDIPPSPLGPLAEELAEDLVAQEIDSLREQRPRMVERPEQALLVYELLIDSLRNT